MRISFLKQLALIALLFSLPKIHALTEMDYRAIFGDEYIISPAVIEEMMYVPMVVMGRTEPVVKVYVNALLEPTRIEAEPFLAHIKKHSILGVYQQVAALEKDGFIEIELLPSGVALNLDENLSAILDLAPQVIRPIDPTLSTKKVLYRQPLISDIISSVHDVDASTTRLDGNQSSVVNIDSSFRLNRVVLSGRSFYKDRQTTYFKEDWLAKYEDYDKSYYYGQIKNPVFANTAPKALEKGIAVGNVDLRGSVVFSDNSRYIDLAYPAEVKIYIDDRLHEQKSLAAGKHRLNIPVQDNLFQVRVEVKDTYGRLETYDFSAAGSGVESIPEPNHPIYFVSLGENSNNKHQAYGAIEWALDDLSKAQVALNHVETEDSIAARYYRILPKGSIKSTVTIGRVSGNHGFGIKTTRGAILDKKNTLIMTHNYQKDLALEAIANENEHYASINLSHKFNPRTTVHTSVEHDIRNNHTYHSMSAKYQFSRALDLVLSHHKYQNQDKSAEINLTYRFGQEPHIASITHKTGEQNPNKTLHYRLDDQSYLDLEHSDTNKMVQYGLNGEVFRSKLKLNHKGNQQKEYKLETNFSVVSAKDSIALARTIGDYYGFGMFETDHDFIGDLALGLDSGRCQLSADDQCVILIHPESQRKITYQTDRLPLGVSVFPQELVVMVPSRGGVKHQISTRQNYFIEGGLIDQQARPVMLVMGNIVDKHGNKTLTFADESGAFVAELYEGVYTFEIPGYEPVTLSVSKDAADEGFISIGRLVLKRKLKD